jgi:ribonucleotide reductase alpha subunit
VQGLADVLALMRHPWESEAAAELNQRIFEHLYYAAVQTSVALAAEKGSYETFAAHERPTSEHSTSVKTFPGSPASQARPLEHNTPNCNRRDPRLGWPPRSRRHRSP